MLTFVMSNHHLLMFWWSPPSLVCVTALSSHPCSEHSRWVTLASMESVSHPIISCHNISSIFAYRSSCVAHFGPQPYYSPSSWELSQWLPGQPCTLCSDKGSNFLVPQSHFFHYSWCQSISHITIFPRALVEDPNCLTYRGPYPVNISSFISGEWPKGQCILVPSSIPVRCLRSSRGTHYCPLTWLFHAPDSYTWWSSDASDCTSDSRVCVRCLKPHEGVALQVASHMPKCIPIML